MARQGAVALTLDMSYSPERAAAVPAGMAGVRARAQTEVDAVREIRRSVDFLRSLSTSWTATGSATWGGAQAPAWARWPPASSTGSGRSTSSQAARHRCRSTSTSPRRSPAELRIVLGRTDPLRFVGHASPSALLFQDGRADKIVPEPALSAACGDRKRTEGHALVPSRPRPEPKAWTDSRAGSRTTSA